MGEGNRDTKTKFVPGRMGLLYQETVAEELSSALAKQTFYTTELQFNVSSLSLFFHLCDSGSDLHCGLTYVAHFFHSYSFQ